MGQVSLVFSNSGWNQQLKKKPLSFENKRNAMLAPANEAQRTCFSVVQNGEYDIDNPQPTQLV